VNEECFPPHLNAVNILLFFAKFKIVNKIIQSSKSLYFIDTKKDNNSKLLQKDDVCFQ